MTCDDTRGDPLGHEWKDATCLDAQYCVVCEKEGNPPVGHDWREATCAAPKNCSRCGMEEGKTLSHTWKDATCESPKTCTVCGAMEGKAKDHKWKRQTETTPKMCTVCKYMEPMKLPQSGEKLLPPTWYPASAITVNTSSYNCFIKLKDKNLKDVITIFVRANESIRIPVQGGSYYVYFAQGTDWYGPEYLFGEDTIYSRDTNFCDFRVYTWNYTLNTQKKTSNFNEEIISADEF